MLSLLWVEYTFFVEEYVFYQVAHCGFYPFLVNQLLQTYLLKLYETEPLRVHLLCFLFQRLDLVLDSLEVFVMFEVLGVLSWVMSIRLLSLVCLVFFLDFGEVSIMEDELELIDDLLLELKEALLDFFDDCFELEMVVCQHDFRRRLAKEPHHFVRLFFWQFERFS